MATPQFHSLDILSVNPETKDAITVTFAVPDSLKDQYRFVQGQFLTLKAMVGDEELRRSYSICAAVPDYQNKGLLRVGIKRVAGGRFSNWANDTLAAGQSLEVMTPDGRFFTPLSPANPRHYTGFAGGSGITPMLSLIATTLEVEPQSRFTLIYGNRDLQSIMFIEALEGLKNRFMDRFRLIHILAEEPQDVPLFNGLLNQEKCAALLSNLVPAASIDHAFICGPGPMMDAAEAALLAAGVAPQAISIERFGTPNPSGAPPAATTISADAPASEVTIISDGKSRVIRVPFEGTSILDAGLLKGANLPYACKGGVCCTCRAKIVEGEVTMARNFTLEQWEIDKGFVLTCQSSPVTDKVVVNYDER
ncbi:MAG: 1,2-phenylacetyl-CoA epoxidase subunit PaaE [Burkholderiaceae bacterium]